MHLLVFLLLQQQNAFTPTFGPGAQLAGPPGAALLWGSSKDISDFFTPNLDQNKMKEFNNYKPQQSNPVEETRDARKAEFKQLNRVGAMEGAPARTKQNRQQS